MASEGFQWTSDQGFPFEGSSPLQGPDNFTPFSGSQDMDQLNLSPTAGAMDAGVQSLDWPTNQSMAQDFFAFSPSTNMSQFSNTMDNTFDLTLWNPYTTNQDFSGADLFSAQAQPQRHQSSNSIDVSSRPNTMRQNSYAVQYQGVQGPLQSGTSTTPMKSVSGEFGQHASESM
jgi:hypothetical protein